MKYKAIKDSFEGCANKREVLDVIEDLVVGELDKIDINKLFTIDEEDIPFNTRVKKGHSFTVSITPRFSSQFRKKIGKEVKRCVGYDIKIKGE